MDSVHHIWCPLFSQEFQDLPDGAETTLTLSELQDVLDRCPSPKKIGFYTIGDKSIYLYDLRRMDEIMEALDNRSSMDWCVAVHDMNAGFDEKILFPSSVESTAG